MNKSFIGLGQYCRAIARRDIVAIALVMLASSSAVFSAEIHDAARIGGVEWAARLIEADPKLVFSKDKLGWTPLHYAAQEGYTNLVQVFLTHKADVNAKSNIGWTALHLVVADGEKDAMGVAKLLLANKADVNARANDGGTALHWAVQTGKREMVELLLSYKADVNARNKCGVTPLSSAAGEDKKDLAELLRRHGAH